MTLRSAEDVIAAIRVVLGFEPEESAVLLTIGGRWLDDDDATVATPAVVVNQAVARRYFGDGPAVGAYLDWYGGSAAPTRVEIVGVVEDIRDGSLEREPFAEVFLDYRHVSRILEQGR